MQIGCDLCKAEALNNGRLLYQTDSQLMIVISYDISDDKLRTKFSKYLSRFGHRLQYSVFEIDNSTRILNNIITDLKNKYERAFSQSDSVIILKCLQVAR